MSHKHGAYLGGIRTVEDLRSRCYCDPDSGCWHWRLAIVQGSPKVHFLAADTGKFIGARGRMAALYLKRGKPIRAGHVAFAVDTCKSADCVNPDHTRSGDRKAAGAAHRKAGTFKNNPNKIAAARRTARKFLSKLSVDQVLAIKASPLSTYALARQYEMSQFSMWRIKSGEGWAGIGEGSSVFNWRPA